LLEDRRFVAVRLSNDDVLIEQDGSVGVHRSQAILRKIHNHRTLRKGVRKPAPALQGQLNLANAGGAGRVELLDGSRVKLAAWTLPMPALVVLHTLDERALVNCRMRRQLSSRGDIADQL